MFKKLKIVKALGHLGKGKEKFTVNLKVKPLHMEVQSNLAFDLRLKIERGDRKPDPTNPKRVERSVNNSDIKNLAFAEAFDIQCTYYINKGIPEDKTLNFIVTMVTPDGKDPVIF